MNSPRSLAELIDIVDPAWPLVLEWLRSGRNDVEVLPVDREQGEATLLALQVTTRAPLGAVAFESGGLLVDRRWLRILGAGCDRMSGSLLTWLGTAGNGLAAVPPDPKLEGALVIANDAAGGFFLLDGGGLGVAHRGVVYAAPDTLDWVDLGLGYSDFLRWAADGDLADFYADLRWPGWEGDALDLDLDRGFAFAPPLFTKEGRAARLDPASRRAVPLRELWGLWHDLRAQLG